MNRPGSPRRRRLRASSMIVLVGLLVGLLPVGPSASARTPAADSGLSFDGASGAADGDYVTMGTPPSLQASQFTLELWFNCTADAIVNTQCAAIDGTDTSGAGGGGLQGAISLIAKGRGEGDGDETRDINYFFGIQGGTGANAGKLVADFEEGAAGASPSLNHGITGTSVITPFIWHHAAATYDGSTWNLYLDGVSEGSLAVGQPVASGSTSPLAIGAAQTVAGSPDGFFAGGIDEARIWNYARTQGEVRSTMNDEVTAAPGLVGRWGMNEGGAATTTADSTGSPANGDLGAGSAANRPTWTTGAFFGNSAVALTGDPALGAGSQQYITMGAAGGLGARQFTLELWFKQTGTGVVGRTGSGGLADVIPLIAKGRNQGDGSNLDMNYYLGIQGSPSGGPVNPNAGKLVVDFEDTNTGLNHPFVGTTVVTQNVWHHASGTYDGSVWRIYLDGVLDGTSAPIPAAMATPRFDSIQHFAIGAALGSTGALDTPARPRGLFAGLVDEVRVWNVARTGADIQAGIGRSIASAPNLIGSWRLNAASGTAAVNTGSAAAADGTLTACTVNGCDTAGEHGASAAVGWGLGAPFSVNHAPVVSSATIDQASPHTDGTISVTVASSDSDGDSRTIDYQWLANGVDIPGATGRTLNLAPPGHGDEGDQISVRVRAHDGFTYSAPLTSVPVTVVVGNVAPVVDSVSIDESSPDTNDVLHVTVAAHDDNGDALTRTYQWRKDGSVLPGETGSSLDLGPAGTGDAGDQISVEVVVHDGSLDSAPVESSPVTIGNAAPVVDSVDIDQSRPGTDGVLSVTVTAHDDDPGDVLSFSYEWQKNGSDIPGETGATLDLGRPGNGSRDDNIRVRVTANDGSTDSPPETSAPVTIVNSAPSVSSATVTPREPDTNDILSVDVVSSDPDNDTVTYTYQWLMNGSPLAGRTDATLNLGAAGNGDKGNQISVEVTANDGATNSAHATSSPVTVQNSAPVINSVTIDQSSPHTNDVLSVTVASADPDNDGVSYTYQWRKNGTDLVGQTASTFGLAAAGTGDKDDGISVRVTAFDGTAASTPVTSTVVTVVSTAPTATVSLDNRSPSTGATITATATKTDVDPGDVVTLTYLWKVDGTIVKITSNTSALVDTLNLGTPGNGDNGDTVTVTVKGNDGTVHGTPVTDVASVGNAAPAISSVTIDESSPQTGDTLWAIVTASDPDLDALTNSYQWQKNSVDIPGATGATLNLATAGNGEKNDRISVRVVAGDGWASSSPVTSSTVTIQNTAPTMSSVVIGRSSLHTDDVLWVNVASADLDGDVQAYTYQWRKGGVDIAGATGATLNLATAGNGDRGEEISVRVAAHDGSASSTGLTSSAETILNSRPSATLALDRHALGTTDTLIATATKADLDAGDTVTLTYEWSVNGTTRRTTVTTALKDTFDLSLGGNGGSRDTVTVTVTASDGTIAAAPVADSATLARGGGNLPDQQSQSLIAQDQPTGGLGDTFAAMFDESIGPYSAETAPWTFAHVPSGGTLSSVNESGNQATLQITEGAGAQDTAVGTFMIALAANPNGIRDVAWDPSSFVARAPTD
jgi:concanavalin A-like lectin/glucanase superfamily protein